MKGKFYAYLLLSFWEKLIFAIVVWSSVCNFMLEDKIGSKLTLFLFSSLYYEKVPKIQLTEQNYRHFQCYLDSPIVPKVTNVQDLFKFLNYLKFITLVGLTQALMTAKDPIDQIEQEYSQLATWWLLLLTPPVLNPFRVEIVAYHIVPSSNVPY